MISQNALLNCLPFIAMEITLLTEQLLNEIQHTRSRMRAHQDKTKRATSHFCSSPALQLV